MGNFDHLTRDEILTEIAVIKNLIEKFYEDDLTIYELQENLEDLLILLDNKTEEELQNGDFPKKFE